MRVFLQKNFWIVLVGDVLLLCLSYYSAYWLRFEGELNAYLVHQVVITLIPLLFLKILCFFLFDLYSGMWRYTSVKDLMNIIKGSLLGSFLFVVYLAMVHHFSDISRSVVLMDGIFTVVAIGGFRLLIRIYYQNAPHIVGEIRFWRKAIREGKKVLILGTGPLAERLFRELVSTHRFEYNVVGFVDNGGSYTGKKIHGIPILGSLDEIRNLVDFYGIDDVFVALSEGDAKKVTGLIESCSGLGVRFKVIPSLSERINGSVTKHLRDARVEDLLQRKPINLDMGLVRSEVEGKRILITGAGGSIGSEIARQVLRFSPSQLILLDNAETPLYSIDMELQGRENNTKVLPRIGDIRTLKGLDRIFSEFKPQLVYHSAAYKHVPMMEDNPFDAIDNNIVGTYKLASVACKHHVEKFVMISTDKAVHPSSVMGVTKRVAEMVTQVMNEDETRFVVVRFGNVLGSNGSVVPLFEKQIAEGGPVTVTHPEVSRYFMTIPEAVMLVLQAGAIGKGGDVFLLDMGESVKILDLAKNMIRLAGLVPDQDIKIEFIGLRPGEKLHEQLLREGEDVVDTAYDKIKICADGRCFDRSTLFENIERLNQVTKESGELNEALKILKELVPSYNNHHKEPVVNEGRI